MIAGVSNSFAEEQTRVLRIYSDAEGNSHMEELIVATASSGHGREAQAVSVTEALVKEYRSQTVSDWQTAPARQFAITIVGELEVEVSGGLRRRVHTGELVFLEDTSGRGHLVRMSGPVTNLYIRVSDSFDVVAWSRAKLRGTSETDI